MPARDRPGRIGWPKRRSTGEIMRRTDPSDRGTGARSPGTAAASAWPSCHRTVACGLLRRALICAAKRPGQHSWSAFREYARSRTTQTTTRRTRLLTGDAAPAARPPGPQFDARVITIEVCHVHDAEALAFTPAVDTAQNSTHLRRDRSSSGIQDLACFPCGTRGTAHQLSCESTTCSARYTAPRATVDGRRRSPPACAQSPPPSCRQSSRQPHGSGWPTGPAHPSELPQ